MVAVDREQYMAQEWRCYDYLFVVYTRSVTALYLVRIVCVLEIAMPGPKDDLAAARLITDAPRELRYGESGAKHSLRTRENWLGRRSAGSAIPGAFGKAKWGMRAQFQTQKQVQDGRRPS
jgi:hypothetical protein